MPNQLPPNQLPPNAPPPNGPPPNGPPPNGLRRAAMALARHLAGQQSIVISYINFFQRLLFGGVFHFCTPFYKMWRSS